MDVPNLLKASVFVVVPVLARVLALVMTLPLTSSAVVPLRLRAVLVIALTAAILPICSTHTPAPAWHGDWQAAGIIVQELLIGATLGLAARLLLGAATVAGYLIEQLSGIGFAWPPGEDEATGGVLTRLFWWTVIATFVVSGGVNQLVAGMVQSFVVWPPGGSHFDQGFVHILGTAMTAGLEFGVRAAVPAIVALLTASAVVAMIQRQCPQLGGMQVGLGLNTVTGLVVTSLLLLTTPWIVQGGFLEVWPQWIEAAATARSGR